MKLILAIMVAVLISVADFQNQKVLWVFTADWCHACKQYEKTLQMAEAKKIKVYRINVDKRPKLTKKYHITSIPATLVMKNRKEQARKIGNIPLKSLFKLIGNSAP